MFSRKPKPQVISTRKNGDRLIGETGPLAEDLYAAGTPPMHGLAAKHEASPRVARVKIGDTLRIERVADHWTVSDGAGELGWCRWQPTDDGRVHAVTGLVMRFPSSGILHVQRLVVDRSGTVKDIGGYVEPDGSRDVRS